MRRKEIKLKGNLGRETKEYRVYYILQNRDIILDGKKIYISKRFPRYKYINITISIEKDINENEILKIIKNVHKDTIMDNDIL